MLLSEIYPSNYVKAADLKGREVTVVIASSAIEKIGTDTKLVIYFQGKDKGLVANKTNCSRIAMLYGNDTDDWIGKEIVLGVDFVDFQGKTVEAIRVKPPKNRTAAPQQRQHVVTDKGGYSLSEMKPANKPPAELPEDGDVIPF